MKSIIRNACLVNEGNLFHADVLISNDRIEKIDGKIELNGHIRCEEICGEGLHLMPGFIDDQVHFREPGLTHKASIFTESAAAVAGGITSFMDMPNTIPNTTSLNLLEDKYVIAAQSSLANYSFFLGINENNLEECLKMDTEWNCGLSDDGLYFNNERGIMANYPDYLEKLFSQTGCLVALHCEDDEIIAANTAYYSKMLGNKIPMSFHPKIRNHECCMKATKRVVDIANKHQSRVHILHVSTNEETELFDNTIPVNQKRITAEACVHHMFFTESDYEKKGASIKWNPSVKSEKDKAGLIKALNDNRLDIIATDHAPHTTGEKSGDYFQSHSGGPLVQHGLTALLDLYHQGLLSLNKIVEKTSHHVAEIYRIKDRGYLREGYYADLVLLDLNNPWQVNTQNILYKCGWSPFENHTFKSKVIKTIVNGKVVYDHGCILQRRTGMRLQFSKTR